MLVKDNDNILTHNQWSVGQYLKNTTGFNRYRGVTLEVTDRLILTQDNTDNYGWCDIPMELEPLTEYTITAKLKTNFTWAMALNNDGNTPIGRVTINANDDIQTVTLTLTTPEEISNNLIRFFHSTPNAMLELVEIILQ